MRNKVKLTQTSKELVVTNKELNDYKYALDESCIVEITDREGIITFVNDNFCLISKYSKEELIGKDYSIVDSNYHTQEFMKNKSSTLKNGNVWKGDIRNMAKDGTFYWVDTTIVPFIDESGVPYQYLSIRADITERKKMEEKAVKSALQIRSFASYLNRVLEEERAHLAREIHDELGQQLVGIKIGLSTMMNNNRKETYSVQEMIKNVDGTIQSLRKIATELRPGILDSLGLYPSIQWLASEFELKNRIPCRVNRNGPERKIEKDIATCFFRVCQEALTNISKHAEASQVVIELEELENELTLTVADNGKGISSEILENPFSMGLLGMRERSSILGAHLLIESEKGKGTSIQLKKQLT